MLVSVSFISKNTVKKNINKHLKIQSIDMYEKKHTFVSVFSTQNYDSW